MSILGGKVVGIPTVLLHEANGLSITVEMKGGLLYHGLLEESEDNWNIKLSEVICFQPDGNQFTIGTIFIRGSQIIFIILPDMLANAPMFSRVIQFRKGKTTPPGTRGQLIRRNRNSYRKEQEDNRNTRNRNNSHATSNFKSSQNDRSNQKFK